MNRKQRRSAKHRSPVLAQRAQFEERLRASLKPHDVRLLAIELGRSGEKTKWVLVVERGGLQVTLSANPGTVPVMTEAILWRLDHMHEPEPEPEGVTTQGPDAQPATPAPITTTIVAKHNVLEDDDGELAALIPGST